MKIKTFEFNLFQQHTYILYDESKECAIVDPGCYSVEEKSELSDFIETNELKAVRLINTHCHLDHIFGLHYVNTKYGLTPEFHSQETFVMQHAEPYSHMIGVEYEAAPDAVKYIEPNDTITFGHTELKALFTPGHSPGSLCFYCAESKDVIVGDVLFAGSIGRTDLPGGDYSTLINSITTQLLGLGDDVTVHSGHGLTTTIGREKASNPYLK